jgi:outer membrane PBP1 activator LpoA protein
MLLLSACAGEPPKNQAQPEVKPPRQVQKPAVVSAPIKTYGLSDTQAFQHLQKADALIKAGETAAAQRELDLVAFADLVSEQRSKYNVLDAQIALSTGDAEHALLMLETARPKLLTEADQIDYYKSLGFANSLLGNVSRAVIARMKLSDLLHTPQQQQENVATILDMLSVLSPDSLSTPSAVTDELSGWLSLAKILKQREQPGFNVGEQIQQWRLKYPTHPAKAEFLQAYLAPPAQPAEAAGTSSAGPNIAVLLPASGAFAQAGNAIKDGVLAAHKLAAASAPQLPLKFYDTEQGDIAALYKQAIAEGAKQVIGPLVKEQIQALAQSTELTAPVLALNHVENLSKPNLYQFGLSPIDEAEQLALKAHQEGRINAVLLVPNTSQGQRIANYLTVAWQSNGGTVVGMQSYDAKQHDIANVLNGLLSSTAEPNSQKQQQTVLLSANPEIGRELAPQLKFHQNSDLAVYAMPNIYSGRQSPAQDAELGKISFCDMPWFFADVYSGPLSQTALRNNWQNLTDIQIRLLPLGIDAYNLLGQLNQLNATSYSGATGRLGLNAENRITRKLVCAQFKGGLPVASGFPE